MRKYKNYINMRLTRIVSYVGDIGAGKPAAACGFGIVDPLFAVLEEGL